MPDSHTRDRITTTANRGVSTDGIAARQSPRLDHRRERDRANASHRLFAQPLLEISLLQCGRYCVVALAGELDAYTSCALRERLAAIGAEDSSARVVLDLAAVSFVASAGLGTLVWATKRLRARGGDVVIKAPNAQVARLLEITGLRHILTIDEGAPALPSGIGGCVVVSGDDSPIALSARSMTQGAHHGLERSDI